MKKILAFDLDHTLFDTVAFKHDLFLLFQKNGLPFEVAEKTYQEQIRLNNGNYSFSKHIRLLHEKYDFDTMSLEQAIQQFFTSDFTKYLLHSLNDLAAILKDYDTFIITKGDPDVQWAKIRQSKLNRILSEEQVVITDIKHEASIWKELNDNGGVYINDNWQETQHLMGLFPQMLFILYIRKDANKFYDPQTVTIPTFKTLDELKTFMV